MSYKDYPTVSAILKATESEETKAHLKMWAERIGYEEAERIRQAAMLRGRIIDENVAQYFKEKSCQNELLKKYLSQFEILENEKEVFSDINKYWGRYDQKFSQNGRIILNDFKGAGKPKKKDRYGDNPIQLSAYYFALLEHGEHVDYAQLSYVVDGKREVQRVTFNHGQLKDYYSQFLERLELYRTCANVQGIH